MTDNISPLWRTQTMYFFVLTGLALIAGLIYVLTDRRRELSERRALFAKIRDNQHGLNEPAKIVDMLLSITGKDSVREHNKTHYHIGLAELKISEHDMQVPLRQAFVDWYVHTIKHNPNPSQAIQGAEIFEKQLDGLKSKMMKAGLSLEIIGITGERVESDRVEHIRKCYRQLASALEHHSGADTGNFPKPEELLGALNKHWIEPSVSKPEEEWKGWFKEAKLRQACCLLRKLREAKFIFPQSNQKVDELLGHLQSIGISYNDPKIGTSLVELEELRRLPNPEQPNRQT